MRILNRINTTWYPALQLASVVVIMFLGFGCKQTNNQNTEKEASNTTSANTNSIPMASAPVFSEDSAYKFVAAQVAFGPRVPSSKAHAACGDYLIATLKKFGAEVTIQPFTETAFDGKTLNCRNIIAAINPKATTRILLTSHWDTRPFADQDKIKPMAPLDGANDGASGVGVLLEIARVLQASKEQPNVGVDIIFFDGEDYGETSDYEDKPGEESGKWWCLGSKYWAKNKHQANYSAYFGVLLDMVGGKDAKFWMEGASLQYAPSVVNEVWGTGLKLGFNNFVMQATDAITDDHIYVNQIAKINMIDIIEHDPSDNIYFSKTWHTTEDNLQNISKPTLKAVGQTLIQVLYNQKPS